MGPFNGENWPELLANYSLPTNQLLLFLVVMGIIGLLLAYLDDMTNVIKK